MRLQSLHGYNDIKHDINDANNGKLVKAFVFYDLHQDYLGDETSFCLYLILMETYGLYCRWSCIPFFGFSIRFIFQYDIIYRTGTPWSDRTRRGK